MKERQITGRHVFIVTAAAFSIIIGVNLTLAWNAIATFPGLEVQNSYVASQSFDADRVAQENLGWKAEAEIGEDTLRLAFTDTAGQPVEPASLKATLGRATHVADDLTPAFEFDGIAYVALVDTLAPGNWNLRLSAVSEDGTNFRQRLVLYVRPGR